MTVGAGDGVLLLHGLGRRHASMGRLAAAARREGHATCAPGYPGRKLPVGQLVDFLTPTFAAFAESCDGVIHIVTHSLGGLLARGLIEAQRPDRLGRVVMLAPPHEGSEVADLLYRLKLNRMVMGPVGAALRTGRADGPQRPPAAFELGVIAGDRPLDPVFPRLIFRRANDGKVAVAATRLPGMADHIVLPVSHPLMMYDRRVIAQTMAFLAQGRFRR